MNKFIFDMAYAFRPGTVHSTATDTTVHQHTSLASVIYHFSLLGKVETMSIVPPLQYLPRVGTVRRLLGLLLLLGLLVGCQDSGNNGSLAPSPASSPPVEQQAITNLLDLYRTAVMQEDSDRLAALLQPTALLSQAVLVAVPDATPHDGRLSRSAEVPSPFLDVMSAAFRSLRVTAVALEELQIAADRQNDLRLAGI